MLRILLLTEILLINLLRDSLKVLSLKCLTTIAHVDITLVLKFSIEDQNNKFMSNPIILLNIFQLGIFPLYHLTLIFSFFHLVTIQLDQVLNLLHGVLNIVSL